MEPTLKSLASKVRLETRLVDTPIPEGFCRDTNAWKITLRYRGRQMTVDFFTGPLAGEPDAESILDCLLLDSSADGQSFEDWASELGYDADSRKAERIYQACQKNAKKLKKFLGDDFQTFLHAERN